MLLYIWAVMVNNNGKLFVIVVVELILAIDNIAYKADIIEIFEWGLWDIFLLFYSWESTKR